MTRDLLYVLTFVVASAAHGQNLDSQIDQARQLRLEGKVVQSTSLLSEVLKQDPANFRAQYNLALALAEIDQKSLAGETYKKAIVLGETQGVPDPTIYNSYGWLLMQQGDYATAERFFDKGLQYQDRLSKNSQQRLHNNLGALYLQTGRTGLAKKQFETTGASNSLAIVDAIEKKAAADAGNLQGTVYLGHADAKGEWAEGATTTALSSASAIKVGERITLTDAVNVRDTRGRQGSLSSSPTIGVLSPGDKIQVLAVRESPATDGGKYVWIDMKKVFDGAGETAVLDGK